MNIVLNHEIFHKVLLDILDNSPYGSGELSDFKYWNPKDLIEYFFDGSEKLSPIKDGVMNIDLDDYYTIKKVIGYTNKNTPTIFTNTKYFDKRTSKLIGSFFCHEYGHKKGFDHHFFNTKVRQFSLSYLLNVAYEKAWELIFNGDQAAADKKIVCKRTWKTLFLKKVCYAINN